MTDRADAAGAVSQGYVSRVESGRLTVSGERLPFYAPALGYPSSLLTEVKPEVGAGVGLVHHRKRQAMGAGDLKRIHALRRICLWAVVLAVVV